LHDNHDEGQVSSLRNSLLQHIQSVQREISRLQLERQRAQHCHQDRLQHGSEQPAVPGGSPPQTAIAVAPSLLCSPQGSSRGFSCERERSSDQWRRQSGRRAIQVQSSSQLHLSNGALAQPASCIGAKANVRPTLSPIRSAVTSNINTSAATEAKLDCFKTEVTGITTLHAAGPCAAHGRSSATVKKTSAVDAARIIQRSWRKLSQKAGKPKATASASVSRCLVSGHTQAQSPPRVNERPLTRRSSAAMHWAAGRIQRAWKIHRWRRQFVKFSERQVGWVGSLEWLQIHNLLYGTELADSEDVRWWLQQRATAPLDREVDPWGSDRLLEHLNRMWYGARSAEPHPEPQPKQREAHERVIQSHGQRRDDSFTTVAAAPQDATTQRLGAGPTSFLVENKQTGQTGRDRSAIHVAPEVRHRHIAASASSLRTLPSAELLVGQRQVSAASSAAPAIKATSLSPRHDIVTWSHSDINSRHKGVMLGAPPPASSHSYQRAQNYRVSSHSPPQTHRAPRASVPTNPIPGLVPKRPCSPMQTTRIHNTSSPSNRSSLPSNSSMQTWSVGSVQRPSSSMNRALSGSPPPSVVGRPVVATAPLRR